VYGVEKNWMIGSDRRLPNVAESAESLGNASEIELSLGRSCYAPVYLRNVFSDKRVRWNG